ncbi:acyl-CoA dehydrogenase [Siccirubricoccus sp. KC 17139]|uniref:Acyl-CoA dehydrogenase n=1 Tax=Siccirubricoccus soli TaxID=2899147 RepID=A0ABT1D6Q8_9PROT|nr:acyl-CoA dehydrogenase [Siccirubricoccus soli]MCO6417607.1 acyl-CoA dehydrogenase [Siccirubricoccus soli]MCP2683742.1 acyl-CoA dehydrogenase [Siccirubricoccus soli]
MSAAPTTPAEDLVFGLTRLIDLPGLTGGALAAPDIAAIIGEADRFAREVLWPGAREADLHGAVYENGVVRTPPAYKPAYQAWIEGGWQGLAAPAELNGVEVGGQELPQALWMAVSELVTTGDMAFSLCPLLTAGAIEAIARFASPAQQAAWLPPLVRGEWTGTMCLTEPQAGSDLSLIRTKAEPDGAGGYRLYGQKIFITWGEHELTEDTLHLVLARLPDAPPGTRGISLFAAPKRRADGSRNALRCGGIEKKLGIHASPTCVMLFEGAEAELVGEPHRGLQAMFAMMNAARLGVGVEGVAQGARALALAEAYAAQRLQGGKPIDRHPDVARMLAEIRAMTLAGRLLALEAGAALDRARRGGASEARVALLTPIVKGWCTDRGVECASLGIQVHGGMGFVEETGAAQVLRDARIAPIYEGTNGIQALDLVGRKVLRDGGAEMRALLAEVKAADPRLGEAVAALERATAWLVARGAREPAAAEAGATAYLEACGWTLGGWMLARAAALEPRYAPIATFYLARLLPRAASRVAEIEAADALLALLPAG